MLDKIKRIVRTIKPVKPATALSILDSEHPFRELANGNITRFLSEIESKDDETKIRFASKIVMDCDDLIELGTKLRTAERPTSGNFFRLLDNAYAVRCQLERLSGRDPSGKNQIPQAYQIIVDPDFSSDLFNQYTDLTTQFLTQKRREIVAQIVKDTPENPKAERELFSKLRFIHDEDFNVALSSAFEVKWLIKTELLGENPQEFFLNPELKTKNKNFNTALIADNIELLASRVSGKEEEIGKKLAKSKESSKIAVILTDLETQTEDDVNQTFSKINNAFKLEQKKKVSSNRNSHFAGSNAVSMSPVEREDATPVII